MSDFKIEFNLKQHTPIIHFQANQWGATLRATELKPKLDAFLYEHVPDLPFRKVADDNYTLPYKVQIIHSGSNKIDYPKAHVKNGDKGYVAPYFADGASVEHSKNITVVFLSMRSCVLDAIKRYFPMLLTYENFGTRQSKGFGSYHDVKMTQEIFEAHLLKYPREVYRLKYRASNGKSALQYIDKVYRKMKSGLNPKANNGEHYKSLLFEYMCTKDSGWEKRWIKQTFPSVVYGDHEPIDCSPRKEYHYIRALLGLAEHNEYYPNGPKNKLAVTISGTEDNDIERFRSPLTFKVFDGHIYLLYDDQYFVEEGGILNKTFEFSLKGKSDTLSTPARFDLHEFLSFVVRRETFLEPLGGKK